MPSTRLGAIALISAFLCLTGCGRGAVQGTPTDTAAAPTTEPSSPTLTSPAPSIPPPTQTLISSLTPTPNWEIQGPGLIVCPILLYHHVASAPPGDSAQAAIYYVPPADFELQMQALQAWGYHTISISLLAEAIQHSAALPAHPIVITFDDDNLDVYINAFPIMQKYGFTGVMYVVVDRMQTAGYINADQLKALAAAGWELGDHSLTHLDLRQEHDRLGIELAQSRLILQQAVGVPVNTFAYPFGAEDSIVISQVRADGYTAAVGLGGGWQQGSGNLYYLSRRPVLAGDDLVKLASYLPWSVVPGQPTASPTSSIP
jgi:peptidoglycan/xylan/chitin deacetylase (PgdA/CDA1 family)